MPAAMRAIVAPRFGDAGVLRVEEVPIPEPAEGEVLVRIRASSLNPYDWHFLTGLPRLFRPSFGWRRPKFPVLGADLAGTVEAVGSGVDDLHRGEDVFGQAAAGCFAEFAVVKTKSLAPKPPSLTFEEAAVIPLAGLTALQGIRDKGKVEAGHRVLINGASGGVGTFAVQIAAALGAEVTGVCSTRNLELVESLGASQVIDYTVEDFTERRGEFDLLFDLIGNHPLRRLRRTLQPKGIYLASHGRPEKLWLGPLPFMLRMFMMSPLVSQRLTTFIATTGRDDLNAISSMVESGAVRPVIDRTFPLEQVPDAFRHLEEWHTRGKVAISD